MYVYIFIEAINNVVDVMSVTFKSIFLDWWGTNYLSRYSALCTEWAVDSYK